MKRILRIITVLLVSACLNNLYSQQQFLRGLVLETDQKGNVNPVAGAIVFWSNTTTGTSTDSIGVFKIPLIGSNKLVVTAVGYKTDTIIITKQQFVKVLLVNKTRLNEVIIGYERRSSEVSFIDPLKVTTMSEGELFKAACCNLSESFETNPSVDVSYTDALTGTKQIQMLGLGSQYVQITQEVLPSIRGVATNYGLNYTPGTWLNSIQVSKGSGSVVNGFESIAGQINTQLHEPDINEKVYLNGYVSEGGRYELNLITNAKLNEKLSASVMLHQSEYLLKMDRNNDGFLDNPLGSQQNGLFKFKYNNLKGLIIQGGARLLFDSKVGGQLNFDASNFDTSSASLLYGTRVLAKRGDGWLKAGYVFPRKVYKSIGLQLAVAGQRFDNFYGKNFYGAEQNTYYANLIYQSIIGSTNHKFRTGLSQMIDDIEERLFNNVQYYNNRREIVTGAFVEYTYNYLAKFTLVAGVRYDVNNLYSNQFVPRLHLRYAFTEKTVLRASAAKGWRTVNPVADNAGLLVSNRQHMLAPQLFTLVPWTGNFVNWWPVFQETAYNFGLNLNHDFKFNYRNGTIGMEYYYTLFTQNLVVDRETPDKVFYDFATDASFAHNFQLQLDYQPLRRFDVRLAYRYFNPQMKYRSGWLQVPMVASNRGFVNLSYKTKSKWDFDFTAQIIGRKRLPNTLSNPEVYRLGNYSPVYELVNLQITKTFKKYLAVYGGIENLFDFKQSNPIIDGSNPFSAYFDASMIWGPVFGRMIYGGFRFRL